jgi:hypothetical protein
MQYKEYSGADLWTLHFAPVFGIGPDEVDRIKSLGEASLGGWICIIGFANLAALARYSRFRYVWISYISWLLIDP